MTVKSLHRKYSHMDGYAAKAYSAHTFTIHLSHKFDIPLFELKKAVSKHQILLLSV